MSQFVRVGLFGDIGDTLRSWTYSSSLTSYSTSGSNPQFLPALAEPEPHQPAAPEREE